MNIVKNFQHFGRGISNLWKTRPVNASREIAFRRAAQAGYERGMAHAATRRAQNAYYPGAETGRFRNDWLTKICTSISLLRSSYKTLAARSEYAYRTDPYARRAIDVLKTFVVGSGLRPFPSIKYANGDPVEGLNNKLSADWERFNDQAVRMGSQAVTVYEAQGIEFITMAVLGSWLRQTVRSRPGSFLRYAYTIVKPYRLDFSKDNYYDEAYSKFKIDKSNIVILGQQMNEFAEPSAFWIEGEDTARSIQNMSIHFKLIEAEQYLGIPWLTPSLGGIWDIQQLFEDKLTQSRLLTRMGVWEKKSSMEAMAKILETEEGSSEQSVPFDKSQIYYADDKPEPIQFDDTIAESFSPLVKMALHAIAVGAGFSYGRLTTDLEGANFAGGRINLITDSKIFGSLYKHFYKCSCQPLWDRFVEQEFLEGKIPGATYAQFLSDPWYYKQCYWLPEGEQWVDPLKDAQALLLLYKTGQKTLQQMCAANGDNYKSIIRQRAKEKQELIDAGLEELLPSFDDSAKDTGLAAGDRGAVVNDDNSDQGGNE